MAMMNAERMGGDVAREETGSLISAGRVNGTSVYNTAGDHLGHVDDIMLHKVSGQVAYAVMAFGGFLGIGEKYHPLPWSMLTYDVDRGGYVVPVDRAQLEGAPSYERDEIGSDDTAWRDRIYGYYGVPPYWM